MITTYLMGGLGNQLFEISNAMAYALRTKREYRFFNVKKLEIDGTTPRHTYWTTFLKGLAPVLVEHLDMELAVVKEPGFEYTEIPFIDSKGQCLCLYGYFQSWKYFQDQFATIYQILEIEQAKQGVLSKVGVQRDDLKYNTISMHFRRGDYKDSNGYHPVQEIDYYRTSLQYILDKGGLDRYTVMYFCEKADFEEVHIMIRQLDSIFPNLVFVTSPDGLEDWEEMLIMSECRHHIIANSTFSWWGAYLDPYPDKIVCHPAQWFGKHMGINTSDLCPEEWTSIAST